MKDKVYMLNFSVSGIKNLEKEIKIDFYKKTIDKSFDPRRYNVKAIYGENGAGKTAIVVAVDIFRSLIMDSNYLGEKENQKALQSIVNKVKKEVVLASDYIYYDGSNIRIYNYEIKLGLNSIGLYEIKREALKIKTNSSKAKEIVVFECDEGSIENLLADNEGIREKAVSSTQNLLKKQSIGITCLLAKDDIFSEHPLSALKMMLYDLFFFAAKIQICIANEDDPSLYLKKSALLETENVEEFLNMVYGMVSKAGEYSNENERAVHKDNYDEYEKKIKRMERFIQQFKKDLVSIDIDKTEYKDYYICKLLMNYGGYKVDTVFESTGIAKLVRLYDYLDVAASGGIVFIDEMDSNINDIYLTKIVEFFMEYGEGQLCFTAHNTSPMSALRKNKKAIDFLSNDNRVISWTTNGNFAPDKLYKEGMIEYLPFNIEPEDFIGVLGE